MRKFKYTEQRSDLLGKIKRPLISLEFFTEVKNLWITIHKVLADTGADVSVIPKYVGELLVRNFREGKFYRIRGVVPFSFLDCYIHKLKLRIGDNEFEQLVAIADSDDAPVILGRVNGLDLFNTVYVKGNELILNDS